MDQSYSSSQSLRKIGLMARMRKKFKKACRTVAHTVLPCIYVDEASLEDECLHSSSPNDNPLESIETFSNFKNPEHTSQPSAEKITDASSGFEYTPSFISDFSYPDEKIKDPISFSQQQDRETRIQEALNQTTIFLEEEAKRVSAKIACRPKASVHLRGQTEESEADLRRHAREDFCTASKLNISIEEARAYRKAQEEENQTLVSDALETQPESSKTPEPLFSAPSDLSPAPAPASAAEGTVSAMCFERSAAAEGIPHLSSTLGSTEIVKFTNAADTLPVPTEEQKQEEQEEQEEPVPADSSLKLSPGEEAYRTIQEFAYTWTSCDVLAFFDTLPQSKDYYTSCTERLLERMGYVKNQEVDDVVLCGMLEEIIEGKEIFEKGIATYLTISRYVLYMLLCPPKTEKETKHSFPDSSPDMPSALSLGTSTSASPAASASKSTSASASSGGVSQQSSLASSSHPEPETTPNHTLNCNCQDEKDTSPVTESSTESSADREHEGTSKHVPTSVSLLKKRFEAIAASSAKPVPSISLAASMKPLPTLKSRKKGPPNATEDSSDDSSSLMSQLVEHELFIEARMRNGLCSEEESAKNDTLEEQERKKRARRKACTMGVPTSAFATEKDANVKNRRDR
ncbi:hypothetical protein NECID01_0705 [Nematocida sp. AWRm77]|nr:hypothetical protein NECID01_0705 [Nematocida sp. AWRm77]